ncbi:MAG: oligosaccharide flippase family protein [Caldilineaceae bacterium SB0668_bin_21]|nr:oligosaccharide flippase family protein [Caldilineaceae bacterium SB0668_bin_21]MYC22728.1 oligosaccharide flippase family protein [Caldilineaceae bacterium SB0662_bin_25]
MSPRCLANVMHRLHSFRPDLLALALLTLLPLIWFGPVLFTGKTLLPYDNLYRFQPWQSLQPGITPHNELLSDLVLENAVWKLHVRRTLQQNEIPLWNPQLFTGAPFFAAGQASAAYPLSALFYLLPIEIAFGWFTAIQLAIAGVNAYLLGRVLKLRPVAALFSGVAFQFSGFMVVSVVFTMVIAAASWLPLLLATIERMIQKQEQKGVAGFRPIPYVVAGIGIVGLVVLAGHPEFLYYILLVAGIYTIVRLLVAWRRLQHPGGDHQAQTPSSDQPRREGKRRHVLHALAKIAGWILLIPLLGLAAGAVQLLPLYELVQQNFREGSASYRQILDWAWPDRHILTFLLPDIFGNPSHHHWFDLWALRWQPATVNWLGEASNTIFWGIKNYVEGGNYVGVSTWLLAALAVGVPLATSVFRSGNQNPRMPHSAQSQLRVPTFLFASLALVSLLFAFGTPLYALLFYGLPGWDQLHSPFRWVFPFTLAMSLLGGIGLEQALSFSSNTSNQRFFAFGRLRIRFTWLIGLLPLSAAAAGLTALLAVAASYFIPSPFVNLAQRAVEASDLAQAAFADGRMFWGYQSVGIARFGAFALVAGLLLWRLTRTDDRTAGRESTNDVAPGSHKSRARLVSLLPFSSVALLALELFAVHGAFNPAADPALSPLRNVPPVVRFINQKENAGSRPEIRYAPFRFTTFDPPGSKTFNANVGMYYGWQDIRGYDSIIPKQYVDLMNRVADQSGELLYNRIAPLYASAGPANNHNPFAALENPLLDLLGVKYILSELVVPNSNSWRKVYEDDALRVYENLEVFPRAFIASEAVVLPVAEQPLLDADLRRTVFIEEAPAANEALIPSSPATADTSISRYTANTVFVDVNLSDRGWLVLTDAYFDGWKAYLRPFGGNENDEQELTIHRANSALRAVYLPQSGQWTVRFTYSPMSFKLGLYITFLATMLSLLLLLWWAWGRFYRPEVTAGAARTVAKNSVVPMGLNLANRIIYFVFAMLYVRILGPEGTGQYAWVIAVYGIFEILSRYGLGTLVTREVAADKSKSSLFLTNVLSLRTLLWAVSIVLMALAVGGSRFTSSVGGASNWGGSLANLWASFLAMTTGWSGVESTLGAPAPIGLVEIQAVAVFALVMLVANWSDAFSSLFNAFEKMEYTAGLGIAMALLQVTLGALVLLLGWGIVGLAWVALVVNTVQLIWLNWLVRSTLFRPQWKWDWALQKWMLSTSGPLMINHLLATVFWRIDIWILRPLVGAASVGLYSVALKYLDGLNIIPSTFTLAIFPLMSRLARQEGAALLRSYTLGVRLLLIVSLPLAVAVTLLAQPLIFLLGGVQFTTASSEIAVVSDRLCQMLGETIATFDCGGLSSRSGSVLALQVIIWSIPIGFVNSVTQYVLIAADQQRYLTKAFVFGVVFNLAGNLLLIPVFNFIGAAVVTILSEICLLLLFARRVHRSVGVTPWPDLVWRPLVSAVAMGCLLYGLSAIGVNQWLAILPALAAYAGVFALIGGLADADLQLATRSLLQNRLAWQTQQEAEGT